MRRIAATAALATALASGAAAQDFRAANDVIVTPVAGGFAATSDAGLGARGYWCAAADYAKSVRGAANGARLYIKGTRARGLGQRAPVVFTLDPAGLEPQPATILGASLSRPGSTLAVGHAIGFCVDGKLITDGDR
ncbi:hypothetical protein KDD17_09150 [Sulfitobacter albidus]|uniref:Uncharacterized protein n=1 Tax=Sulfitobacter albidus TaxID=2829501 RepID=A0A975JB96_9RHOB|nr:hypothetical protein [Sulfitobacter albidus]QUJ75192.1 hypothetical protein KDD17_09150 [Sulfitobacter albidus]